jgi:hypothetical protein
VSISEKLGQFIIDIRDIECDLEDYSKEISKLINDDFSVRALRGIMVTVSTLSTAISSMQLTAGRLISLDINGSDLTDITNTLESSLEEESKYYESGSKASEIFANFKTFANRLRMMELYYANHIYLPIQKERTKDGNK